MNITQERTMILKMIENGAINADEGAKLLSSIAQNLGVKTGDVETGGKRSSKWFQVRVTDTNTGKSKATVKLPMALMDWGLRVGAQFAPEVAELDLYELSNILNEGLEGKIVDVLDEEGGEHVEIFID